MLNRSESGPAVDEFDRHGPRVQWNEWGVRTARELGVFTPYSAIPWTPTRLVTVVLHQNYLKEYTFSSVAVARRRSGVVQAAGPPVAADVGPAVYRPPITGDH